jgi:hypothetical protein
MPVVPTRQTRQLANEPRSVNKPSTPPLKAMGSQGESVRAVLGRLGYLDGDLVVAGAQNLQPVIGHGQGV